MIDAGKYGIHSRIQFLADHGGAGRALTDYLQDTEGQLQANGSVESINTRVEGPHRAFCHHPRGPARWSLRAFADVLYE